VILEDEPLEEDKIKLEKEMFYRNIQKNSFVVVPKGDLLEEA
jgi:hypothetical protein